ncbi:hypothetical protein AV530_014756 [Patagioenas fasciata monilis]|uniref:Uncharacterized protein n=1 Tax=Patagioenas fasciata monilis TaxID=372326 RepID=A0A1V4L0W2_PATFA|nr:hypothetical protein AV530_014756 [Patagioenas fasciata monilis]
MESLNLPACVNLANDLQSSRTWTSLQALGRVPHGPCDIWQHRLLPGKHTNHRSWQLGVKRGNTLLFWRSKRKAATNSRGAVNVDEVGGMKDASEEEGIYFLGQVMSNQDESTTQTSSLEEAHAKNRPHLNLRVIHTTQGFLEFNWMATLSPEEHSWEEPENRTLHLVTALVRAGIVNGRSEILSIPSALHRDGRDHKDNSCYADCDYDR